MQHAKHRSDVPLLALLLAWTAYGLARLAAALRPGHRALEVAARAAGEGAPPGA